MIKKFIGICVRKRALVVSGFVVAAIAAVFAVKYANIDAIPDIGENQQIVFTDWPGRSPRDIEEQVTYPLSVELQGIPGVKTVRGMSAFGFSTIYVIFDEDVDYYWSRSRILEKLSSLTQPLPEDAKPVLGPDATGLGQVLWYTLENNGKAPPKSLAELRSLQDWYVRYRLQSVQGVSEVAGVGGFIKEYQIDVDPNRLFGYKIPFSALLVSVKNANIDVGAEVIEDGDREFIIRGLGFIRSVKNIENIVIGNREDIPIRIKDVARVNVGAAFRRGALDKNGTEAVGGVVTMRYGENPKRVIDAVKERIKEIEPGLPKGVSLVPFYDRTELIESTIGTVYSALSQQIIITILVILLFLMHFRSSILVSLTLPFGVGVSFIIMYLAGIDSNIMSLSGIVIAIGSMVDMGIIMTENIYRKLNSSSVSDGKERARVIADGAKEVGPAILTASLTTIVTFIPVFALQGPEGKLFTPLAWTKSLAIAGAVFVSITLIPALSVYLFRGKLKPKPENKLSRKILDVFTPSMKWALDHKKTVLAAALITVVTGVFLASRLGKEFMPQLNEGDISYMPVTTPDVSITKARELLSYTDKVIKSHPLVEYAVGKMGRADTPLDPAPVSMIETIIKLKDREQWPSGTSTEKIIKELDSMLQIPGLINSWEFPIQMRIGMISTGIKTQVGIKIFGDDLKTLEGIASKIAREVEKIEGAYGVYAERITGKPYIEFDIDRIKASRYGLNTGDINRIVQSAVGGMPLGQIYEGRERYPIRARYKRELRSRVEDLKRVLISAPGGKQIPLEQLCEVRIVMGPASIQSENGLLRSMVLLNVRGRDVVGFVEEAKEMIGTTVTLPQGYSLHWAGQYENQIRATKRLSILIPLALLINFIILYFGFASMRKSLIILTAIPVSMAGGFLLLWITGFNTSVAVWVGFIALFGIAVDNGVVFTAYLDDEFARVKPRNNEEINRAIIEGGKKRIRPMIMTTITTIMALAPVMWSMGRGSEVMRPMAMPTLGGMLIVPVSLFIVPVLYGWMAERKLRKESEK